MTGEGAALTARGWALLGGAAVLALVAYLFGLQELYALSAGASVLVASARIWVGSQPWDMHVSRHVHPDRVPAGAEARVELTVVNAGSRATPPVGAADCFDGGRRWARFAIAPLAPGESRRASYRLPAARRGVYHLGPLNLHFGDPMGLARRTSVTAPNTSLTVHPRFDMVPVTSVSSHRDDDVRSSLPVLGRGINEFYALREYVPGDDLRHVHWPSTARVDDLVIRQPENVHWGRVTVAADLRAGVHEGESIEDVLSAVASVAMSSLREGLQVRVVTTAGFDSGHGGGRLHAPAILDALAASHLHRADSTSPYRVIGTDPVVLITTSRATAADINSAVRLGGARGTTIVIIGTASGSAPVAPGLSRHTVKVPVGGSFASAWAAAEAARC
jgi:uncharacterized protein (DUF58 family)